MRRTRDGARSKLLLRWLLRALLGGLAAFHGALLVSRVADGSLADPAVSLQWASALLLLGWGVWIRRRGRSFLRGRSAVAFWVLVLLLHAVSPGSVARADDFGMEAVLWSTSPGLAALALLALWIAMPRQGRTPLASSCAARPVAFLAAGLLLARSIPARGPPAWPLLTAAL